jgi:hypothetical protein
MRHSLHAKLTRGKRSSSKPRPTAWGNDFSGADVTIDPDEILKDLTYGRD